MEDKTVFNVLIADDHELILQAMHKLVGHLRPRLLTHLATNWAEILNILQKPSPIHLAIIDWHMPGADLESFRRLSMSHPDLPIVVVSAETSPEVVRDLFEQANIKGYVPKTDQAAILVQALKLVLAGGKYVPSLILSEANGESEKPPNQAIPPLETAKDASDWGLSSRLQDVLELLAQGLSNKMIARQLGISDLTVKTHVNLLYKQMGVKNRAEATALYLRQQST